MAAVAMELHKRVQEWAEEHPHVFHPDNIKRWQALLEWAENLPQGLVNSLGDSGVICTQS